MSDPSLYHNGHPVEVRAMTYMELQVLMHAKQYLDSPLPEMMIVSSLNSPGFTVWLREIALNSKKT